MFLSLQQKEISGFLKYLWQSDPFKAKWTVLAKAYSVIRDVRGKKQAPLDTFLALMAPFVGIIPPPVYLAILGWEIVVADDGQRALTRKFAPELDTFDEDIISTEHAVHDIIQHACREGYIPADGAEFQLTGLGTATQNVMATNNAVQAIPAAQNHQQPIPIPQQHQQLQLPAAMPGLALGPHHHNQAEVAFAPHQALVGAHPHPLAVVEFRQETLEEASRAVRELISSEEAYELEESVTLRPAEEQAKYFEDRRKEEDAIKAREDRARLRTPPNFDEVPGEDCADKWEIAGTEYPHYEHFNPGNNTQPDYENALGLFFDPYEGDDFDPFNVSEYFDFDMGNTMA